MQIINARRTELSNVIGSDEEWGEVLGRVAKEDLPEEVALEPGPE